MSSPPNSPEPKVGAFQVAILVLTLVVLGGVVTDTLSPLSPEVSHLIHAVDTVVCGIFLVDFFVRLYRAESKGTFLKWGWIDLVASVPNLEVFRWGRLVRVLQIIRLFRGIRSVHKVWTLLFRNRLEGGAVSLGLMAFLLVVFSSLSILICERSPDANIKTTEDAVWWSISTITTVGYGDRYPVTTEGRVVGMILMVAGVGMVAGLSGLVASIFLGARNESHPETKEILARLDRLQATLETRTKENGPSGGASSKA